jgi:hypothetical protein
MKENLRVLSVTLAAFLGVLACNILLTLAASKATFKMKGIVYQNEPIVKAYYRTYKPHPEVNIKSSLRELVLKTQD